MKLLNTNSIALFKNLEEINDGFRIPDEAYVHGKDFHCFEGLGADCYFSNYWYGDKLAAQSFAQILATYFKNEYENIPLAKDTYDFYGMVVFWDLGDKAMVGNINLYPNLSFGGYDNGIAPELVKALKTSKLKSVLFDGNDNNVLELLTSEVSKKTKIELFNIVAHHYQEDYCNMAKEEGIHIKKTSLQSKI